MKYREFGKSGKKVSLLGFGCMRLPVLNRDPKEINEPLAFKMIRKAIDCGVNYIDTAWGYHGGMSEPFLGNKVLKDGYREKVFLATKMPVWLTETYDDLEKYFQQQLIRLETDHIDMYLLHALSKKRWKTLVNIGFERFLEEKKREGKIGQIGFSFHDDLETFKKIIDHYDWDFCQMQLNYMDINNQQGIEGYRYASEKGIAVIIMEPLKGGKLARVPEIVDKVFKKHGMTKEPVYHAFQWTADLPGVSVILSGMSELEQVEQNLEIFDTLEANSLSGEDKKVFDKVRKEFNSMKIIDCTGCEYCMPCPSGVLIPTNFEVYNNAHMYGSLKQEKGFYNSFLSHQQRASACVECRKCESLCPQKLEISQLMKKVHKYLGE